MAKHASIVQWNQSNCRMKRDNDRMTAIGRSGRKPPAPSWQHRLVQAVESKLGSGIAMYTGQS